MRYVEREYPNFHVVDYTKLQNDAYDQWKALINGWNDDLKVLGQFYLSFCDRSLLISFLQNGIP